VLAQNEAKGIDTMGNTDLQGTSKRVRIVLCMLIVLGVTAAVPASGLAADWTSKAAPSADWTSKAAPDADWTS
jgi:hypothetical protein